MKLVIDHHFENIKYITVTLQVIFFTGVSHIHFTSENYCTGIYLKKLWLKMGLKQSKTVKSKMALSFKLSVTLLKCLFIEFDQEFSRHSLHHFKHFD